MATRLFRHKIFLCEAAVPIVLVRCFGRRVSFSWHSITNEAINQLRIRHRCHNSISLKRKPPFAIAHVGIIVQYVSQAQAASCKISCEEYRSHHNVPISGLKKCPWLSKLLFLGFEAPERSAIPFIPLELPDLVVVVVAVIRPLSRDGGMTKDHGAPEEGQLTKAWTRDRRETEIYQKVSGAKSP